MGFFDEYKQKQNELQNKKKNFKELLKEGGRPIAVGLAKYLGGHPDISKQMDGNVTINNAGFFFNVILTLNNIFIPVENIVKVELKNDEQISKDVTLTRLLVFGVFAFGLKKKTKEQRSYLVITYKEDGIENTVLFESKAAGSYSGALMKIRQEYAKANPVAEVLDTNTSDIPEQIKKLSDLKDQGILSEDEFQHKKMELLAKM